MVVEMLMGECHARSERRQRGRRSSGVGGGPSATVRGEDVEGGGFHPAEGQPGGRFVVVAEERYMDVSSGTGA
jgi:hypothetical protein